MNYSFSIDKENFDIKIEKAADTLNVSLGKESYTVKPLSHSNNEIQLTINGSTKTAYISKSENTYHVCIEGTAFQIQDMDDDSMNFASSGGSDSGEVTAPMPGKVIKILIKEGQKVKAGEKVAILEAMKMENELTSPKDGTISKILVKESDLVNAGAKIVEFAS